MLMLGKRRIYPVRLKVGVLSVANRVYSRNLFRDLLILFDAFKEEFTMSALISRSDLDNDLFVADDSFLKNRNISIIDVEWLDNYNVIKTKLKDYEVCHVYSPEYKKPTTAIKTISPRIFIYEFKNVFARVHSSNFFDKEMVVIERLSYLSTDECNYRAGSLVVHGEKRCIVRNPSNTIQINDFCLFLGGNGSFNYYHWLIEIASKILLVTNEMLRDLGISKIIVNRKALEIKQFKEILYILISEQNIKCDVIAFDELYELSLKRVYYINSPNNYLYNTSGIDAAPLHCCLSKEILSSLRDKTLQYMEEIPNAPKKIFLLRNRQFISSHNKRDYNEEQIFEFFKKEGFEGVLVENYSFKEQMYLFNNAEFIVGPTGAFWANIIYCKKNTKAISWLNENMKEFSLYSTLAKIFICDMHFCLSLAENTKVFHGPYHVELDAVKEVYGKVMMRL